jgi:hypothetical protein
VKRSSHQTLYIVFIILTAFAYCLPLGLFIGNTRFSNLWILYIGNFLFLISVLFFVVFYNNSMHNTHTLGDMLIASFRVTFSSIIICLLVAIFFVYVEKHWLIAAPANTVEDRSAGLRPIVLLDAVLVNLFVGCFGGFIGAVTTKRNQNISAGK